MQQSSFYQEADLMLKMIPEVFKETCFALKGGTAINFFWRDMPRLSIDLDLTYLPIEDREISLKKISEALQKVSTSIKKIYKPLRVQHSLIKNTQEISKLLIRSREAQIKIEVNTLRLAHD